MAPAIMAAAVSGSSWSSSWFWFYSADFESLPPISIRAQQTETCARAVSFRRRKYMAGFNRFGRRISVPSSLQVRTELRALVADERVREHCAELDGLVD